MQYAFASTIYLAEVERDVIVLDLMQQRYTLIPCNEQKQFFRRASFERCLWERPCGNRFSRKRSRPVSRQGGFLKSQARQGKWLLLL